jgi:hypothetical protein
VTKLTIYDCRIGLGVNESGKKQISQIDLDNLAFGKFSQTTCWKLILKVKWKTVEIKPYQPLLLEPSSRSSLWSGHI